MKARWEFGSTHHVTTNRWSRSGASVRMWILLATATTLGCSPSEATGSRAGTGGTNLEDATGGTSSSGGASNSGGTSNDVVDAAGTGGAPDAFGGEAPDCGRVASSIKPCSNDPNPCGIHSGFAGDEYCMKPPPEGQGIQIHLGPKNYDDPAEIAKYVVKPGQEFNAYAIANLPLTEDRWFNHVKIQMRPGSHHLVNSLVTGHFPDGFTNTPGCPGDPAGGFPGTQNLVADSPPGGVPAPENVGFGYKLPANTSVCLNHHAYNFSQIVQLREVWINVWFIDEKDVTQKASGVFLSAGPYEGIPAGTKRALTYAADITGDGRIIMLMGHRHAWTERFAVWKNDELVYDSWHWDESVVYDYDSITQNPPLDPEGKQDGASSGPLIVKKGDRLKIECDVNNTSDKTLTFKNQLFGGEMCLLFGAAVGVEIVSAF